MSVAPATGSVLSSAACVVESEVFARTRADAQREWHRGPGHECRGRPQGPLHAAEEPLECAARVIRVSGELANSDLWVWGNSPHDADFSPAAVDRRRRCAEGEGRARFPPAHGSLEAVAVQECTKMRTVSEARIVLCNEQR